MASYLNGTSLIKGIQAGMSNSYAVLSNLYKKSLKLPIVKIMVISEVDSFKKVEFESWFKEINDPESAIWIGEGISNQFTIKLTRSSDRVLQAPIKNDFGYIVVSGKHAFIKVLQFDPSELPEKVESTSNEEMNIETSSNDEEEVI